jgi:hypothetical protein
MMYKSCRAISASIDFIYIIGLRSICESKTILKSPAVDVPAEFWSSTFSFEKQSFIWPSGRLVRCLKDIFFLFIIFVGL